MENPIKISFADRKSIYLYCLVAKKKKNQQQQRKVVKILSQNQKRMNTKPGFSESLELTSTISPEIGEFISLLALTLSTAPKPPPLETDPPESGSSTNTTSPRWSCKIHSSKASNSESIYKLNFKLRSSFINLLVLSISEMLFF